MDLIDFSKWNEATGELPWGVQSAFVSALELVSEGKTHMTWGSDYGNDSSPCLVNSVSQMTQAGGGFGVPSSSFGEVVREFDRINSALSSRKVNTNSHVSPMAAEILLANFGPRKERPSVPEDSPFKDDLHNSTPELSDDHLIMDWLTTHTEAPVESPKTEDAPSRSIY